MYLKLSFLHFAACEYTYYSVEKHARHVPIKRALGIDHDTLNYMFVAMSYTHASYQAVHYTVLAKHVTVYLTCKFRF